MFSKLAGLVSIQAEQIERIDTQVGGRGRELVAGITGAASCDGFVLISD
jgi:hypothetical protein